MEQDLAADDLARIGHQAEDGQRRDALAAAGLADDAEGFSRRPDRSSRRRPPLPRPSSVKNCVLRSVDLAGWESVTAVRRGSKASRNPSPRKLNASRVIESAIAGHSIMWGSNGERSIPPRPWSPTTALVARTPSPR